MATYTVGVSKTYSTITAGVNAANQVGDLVEVYAGTYAAEPSDYLFVNNRPGITIRAMGAVTVKCASDTPLSVVRLYGTSDGVTFDTATGGSWTWDASKADGSYRASAFKVDPNLSATVKGATIYGGLKPVYLLAGVCALENCTITDNGQSLGNNALVWIEDANNCTLKNCTLTASGTGTVNGIRYTAGGTTANTLSLSGCTFSAGVSTYAISMECSANLIVDGCTITGSDGIDSIVSCVTAATNGAVTFTRNTVSCTVAPAKAWINVGASARSVKITGNTFISSVATEAQSTVALTGQPNALVADNVFDFASTQDAQTCVNITSTGTDASGAVVRNNTFRLRAKTGGRVVVIGSDDMVAACIGKCAKARIEYNRIYGPVYYGVTPSSAVTLRGIVYGWNNGGRIEHNYVTGVGYGIVVKSGTATTQDWATAAGVCYNTVTNCSAAHITVKAVANLTVEHNTMYVSPSKAVVGGSLVMITNNAVSEPVDERGNASGTIVRRNIFSAPSGMYHVYIVDIAEGPSTFADNCYWGAKWYYVGTAPTTLADWKAVSETGSSFDAVGSIAANPLFANPAMADFSLRDESPCINPGWLGRLDVRAQIANRRQYAWGSHPARNGQAGSLRSGGLER